MPSTTVHFPPDVLRRIDATARRRGISRNRFVVQACETAVAHDAGQWPEDFFALDIAAADRALLEEAAGEMEKVILQGRRNRGAALL